MPTDIGQETLQRIAMMPRFNAWLAANVAEYLGDRVLEVGCGVGTLTQHFVREGRHIVGCDIREDYLQVVTERWRRDGVQTVLWDVQEPPRPPLAASPFDSVVCLNVLEHIDHDDLALRNMISLLRPFGRLILFVPALPWLYGTLDEKLHHRRRYHKTVLCEQIRALSCRIRRATYMNMAGIFGWFLNARILKRDILPTRQLLLYDRLVPVFRLVERLTGPPIGQSLFIVAERVGSEPVEEGTGAKKGTQPFSRGDPLC